MKIKSVIVYFLFSLLIFLTLPFCLYSAQLVTGDITSAVILQERIHLNVGDKAVTNLGSKDGLIKGDILTVTARQDILKEKPIGQCAVTGVDTKSSVCEIIASSMEIPRGSNVSFPAMYYSMENFYPVIYKMLSKSVDPFAPHEKIRVAIYDIFDSQNNVTQFSDRLKQEMKDIFSEKRRIRIIEPKSVKRDFFLYPDDIRSSYGLRTEVMETLGVDVFIVGSYALNNESASFTFYKFDRNLNDEKISFQVSLGSSEAITAQAITRAYRPIPKKEYLPCTVAYKEHHFSPQKEEKREIIGHEAGNDIFKAYDLRKTNFNIISPVEVVFKLDGQLVNFSGRTEVPVILTKGTHNLFAAFRRGYFFNTRDPKLYVSDKLVAKEAILTVEKDASIYIEVLLNPSFEGENIEFKIYDVAEKKAQLLKTIIKTEASRTVELFKD